VEATLAIVERAHRGRVEQQYAHVLWLAHALHRQSPMTVLLRGLAALYALDAAPPPPHRLGDGPWGVQPDYRSALDRLRVDGARVFVCAASLAQLGVADRPLHPDLPAVTVAGIAELVARHRRVWFL
jgi:hypothetical protein